jgi:phosphonate dehydrogenase
MAKPLRIFASQRIFDSTRNLLERHASLTVHDGDGSPLPTEQWIAAAAGCHGLLSFMTDRVTPFELGLLPDLRAVSAVLRGADNFDVDAMAQAGVSFSLCRDLLTKPTAELAITLALTMMRQVVPSQTHVRSGRFKGWEPTFYGATLQGAAVGVLGWGSVGQEVGRLLAPFTDNITFTDNIAFMDRGSSSPGVGPRQLPLDSLLRESDVVFNCLPYAPSTKLILDSERLTEGIASGVYCLPSTTVCPQMMSALK